MISLREAQKQLTRQRLLDSAQEIFSTKGYVNATVDDIAATAGASRATFYLHFESKLAILIEISTSAVVPTPELYAGLDQALSEGSRASIEGAIDRIISWWEDNSGFMQAWGEAAMVEPEVPRRERHMAKEYFQAMPFLRSCWPPAQQDKARLRISLFVMQLERYFERYAASGEFDAQRADLLEAITDIWSQGFFPPRSTSGSPPKGARKTPRTTSK